MVSIPYSRTSVQRRANQFPKTSLHKSPSIKICSKKPAFIPDQPPALDYHSSNSSASSPTKSVKNPIKRRLTILSNRSSREQNPLTASKTCVSVDVLSNNSENCVEYDESNLPGLLSRQNSLRCNFSSSNPELHIAGRPVGNAVGGGISSDSRVFHYAALRTCLTFWIATLFQRFEQ